MALRRMFGLKKDAVSGGSEYDDLTAGAIPDADIFWPVTGGTVDSNITRIDRNAEVRGRRAATAPLVFQAAPVMTVPIAAYRSVVELALAYCLGVDTKSGSAVPYTHEIAALEFDDLAGGAKLPTLHGQIIRDDLNHKMSGGHVNRVSLSFPLDGEGTAEVELWGLFYDQFADAQPTVDFDSISPDVLTLRDATMEIDGGPAAIPDLTGFDFSFSNNMTRKHYAGRNVVSKTLPDTNTRKLWFPAENKLGAMQDVTFGMSIGNTSTAQDIAHDWGQIQAFVFECTGGPLSSGNEILRITIYNGVWTGGGADALTARDDITARYEGGAFYSEVDTADIKIEVVNDIATDLITGD